MSWFALYVIHPRKAEASLTEAGFVVFAPKYHRWVRKAHKSTLQPEHLFPGYIFTQTDYPHSAALCEGVAYVVGAPSPPTIPQHIIEDVQALIDSGRMDEPISTTRARPRKIRFKAMADLRSWFDQTQPLAKQAC